MKSRIAMAVALAGGISLAATACSGSDSSGTASSASPSSSSSSPAASPSATTNAAAAGLVGAGCAAYAKVVPSGAGSIQGMSQDPVAVAASNNPVLKSLTAAVSGKANPKVNLVKNLDGGQFTVFAPVDSAFAKLPPKTVKTLGTPAGAPTLTSVLTYHVILGQLSPDKIAGTHKTVEGAELTVRGSGDKLTVGSGSAHVICGGVKTANATVYLIDSVLMPPTTN